MDVKRNSPLQLYLSVVCYKSTVTLASWATVCNGSDYKNWFPSSKTIPIVLLHSLRHRIILGHMRFDSFVSKYLEIHRSVSYTHLDVYKRQVYGRPFTLATPVLINKSGDTEISSNSGPSGYARIPITGVRVRQWRFWPKYLVVDKKK